MAIEIPGMKLTLVAAADLSAASNKYKFVKVDGNGNVIIDAAVTMQME